MSAHVHDGSIRPDRRQAPAGGGGAGARPALPRWLLPGLAVATVAAGLVAAGVVPLSTMLFVALIGGMVLMHAGGHGGHGAHGAHGDRHDTGQGDADDPRRRSAALPEGAEPSRRATEDVAPDDGSEGDDDDRRTSGGCH